MRVYPRNIRGPYVVTHRTEQEQFWQGGFGDQYIGRNTKNSQQITSLKLFFEVLQRTCGMKSAIEFGCNIGFNLHSLQKLVPDIVLTGIEINEKACNVARTSLPKAEIQLGSIFDYKVEKKYDLAFTRGVLIHINPDMLPNAYEKLYTSSQKYILVAEYYNPTPISISYHGHGDRLFKRDFAGEILDTYPDLKLVSYGFLYHNDPNFPDDDLTWFLMEK